MKKRTNRIAALVLILVAALTLCFAACNNEGEKSNVSAGDKLSADMKADELIETLCKTKNYTITWKSYFLENGVKKYKDGTISFAIDNTDVHFKEISASYYDEWYSFAKDGKVYIYDVKNSVVVDLEESFGIDIDVNDAGYGWLDFDKYFAEDYGVEVDCSVYVGYEAEIGTSEAMGMSVLTTYFQLFRAIKEGKIFHDGEKLVSSSEDVVVAFADNTVTFAASTQYAGYYDPQENEYFEVTVSLINATKIDMPQDVINP